jgi:hypothetical protein
VKVFSDECGCAHLHVRIVGRAKPSCILLEAPTTPQRLHPKKTIHPKHSHIHALSPESPTPEAAAAPLLQRGHNKGNQHKPADLQPRTGLRSSRHFVKP